MICMERVKMESVIVMMVFYVVSVSCHNYGTFRVMNDEICDTSGKGAPNGAFPAAANNNEVSCLLIG